MKVALCLFGIVGGKEGKDGKGGNVDYQIAFDHYKKHILDKNDVDVFIHTWSIELEEELKAIYKPKKVFFRNRKGLHGLIEKIMIKSTGPIVDGIVQKKLLN